jgi:hypothetical protein
MVKSRVVLPEDWLDVMVAPEIWEAVMFPLLMDRSTLLLSSVMVAFMVVELGIGVGVGVGVGVADDEGFGVGLGDGDEDWLGVGEGEGVGVGVAKG